MRQKYTRFPSLEDMFIPEPNSGCWLWLANSQSDRASGPGYGMIRIKGKPKLAHRHFYELYKGPIPSGKFVMHTCDNPACVNPEHLFVGTAQDNMDDMTKKGRRNPPHGVRNSHAKLTPEIVLEIFSDGRGVTNIARSFGITPGTVCNIKSGISWNRVTGLSNPLRPHVRYSLPTRVVVG